MLAAHNARLEHIETTLERVVTRQDRTEQAITRLASRVDSFTKAVMQGFTDGAQRVYKVERRVSVLERRITPKRRPKK